MTPISPDVDVVIPVHNEAESVCDTLLEFHRIVAIEGGVRLRFVVTEDGSRDGTADVVRGLQQELPIELVTSPTRKGYSQAVIDGMEAATAPYVGYVDGDGQYDPADFLELYQRRADADLVVGYRSPRMDHWVRKAMSAGFHFVYKGLFSVGLEDPSCPYGIMRRENVQKLLTANRTYLPQGFWWEFYARAGAAELSIVQIPVRHRVRPVGQTQVYRPAKLPRIVAAHLAGLVMLRRELRSRSD